MTKLVVIPTNNECTLFLKKCIELGHEYVEVHMGITDFADHQSEDDFFKHLEAVMGNLAELVVDSAQKERGG